MSAETKLQRHNERFELLLNLTTQITSSLDLREVLRAVAANIREAIDADAVAVALPDAASGKFRVFAVDFPHGKGVIKEELLLPLSSEAKRAMETLKPIVFDPRERDEHAPEPYDVAAAEGLKAVCSIPLVDRGRVLGILSILRTRETPFAPEDVDFLSRASGQIAIAIANALAFQEISELAQGRKRAEQALALQNTRLQLLLELSKRITSNLELREVLRSVSVAAREIMHADAAGVAFFDEASAKSRIYAIDFPNAKGFVKEEIVVTPGLAFKRAWESSKPVVINTNDHDELGPEIYRLVIAEGLKGHCLIPLVSHGRTVGVLIVASKLQGSFTHEDVDFLSQASGQIAIAIENALAFQEVSSLGARLQLLLTLTNRITSSLEFRELLRAIAANIRELMQCDAVSILLYEGQLGKFRVHALDFPHGKGLVREEQLVISDKNDPRTRAFQTLTPVVVTDRDLDQFSPEMRKLATAEGVKTACFIPLVNHGRALGVLGISRITEGSFSQQDVEFLSQASGQIAIAIENALAYREISELKDKLAQEKLYLEEEFRSEMGFEQIIGNSKALKHVLQQVETVAPSDSTVLLLGETGTGKELIARAIHDRSKRKDRTFVKLNCAAIPTGLLESELFGHERGAFTGAITQKIGRLELADQGSLFLDEVGDIPIEIQPKLLRALQEREFERLGSTRTKKVDVRLVAATNRDLERMIESREFRSDLYYRLNVFPIRIPPLRERPEDIPLLVRYFTQKYGRRMEKQIESIPAAAMKKLAAWHWPGNIRELENFIERSVILTRGTALQVPIGELGNGKATSAPSRREADDGDEILRVLKDTRGRVAGPQGAAARMGIKRTTLISRMKKLGIDPRRVS